MVTSRSPRVIRWCGDREVSTTGLSLQQLHDEDHCGGVGLVGDGIGFRQAGSGRDWAKALLTKAGHDANAVLMSLPPMAKWV